MFECRIRIVGVGERRQGISKAGKDYDMLNIAFLYPSKKYEGYACAEAIVPGNNVEKFSMIPGTDYDVLMAWNKDTNPWKPVIGAILREV